MVIQRIQTLYLLIAIILMAVFAFFPALTFSVGEGEYFVYGAMKTGVPGQLHIDPLLTVMIGLIIVLAFVAIFQYHNLQRQMTITFVDIIVAIALLLSIGIQAFVIPDKFPGAQVHWCNPNFLPVLAIVFLMLAHHAMSRDKRKLRDSDRLR